MLLFNLSITLEEIIISFPYLADEESEINEITEIRTILLLKKRGYKKIHEFKTFSSILRNIFLHNKNIHEIVGIQRHHLKFFGACFGGELVYINHYRNLKKS